MDDVLARPVRVSRRLGREVIRLPRTSFGVAGLAFALMGCHLEKPDPASRAAAIPLSLPSASRNPLAAPGAWAQREGANPDPGPAPVSLPVLPKSLDFSLSRLKPLLASAATDRDRM